ncbi:MAG: translation initiation factor IF-3 [Chlamydiota bacterium]|nr:translation initiation factor IF-3 [Chlamydiota bacterium]
MRVNRQIRVPKVRLIDENGNQVGVVSTSDAQRKADDAGLDLVEVVATSTPPVCKIIDYGKYRYDQTKREKESKKSQHQVKVKEVKVKPNINEHDLLTKARHAREFISKGNKVKVTCMFRGREMIHPERGENLVRRFCEELADVATPEAPMKRMGRFLHVVLAPGVRKKKEAPQKPVAPQEKSPKAEKSDGDV